jgi:hypothetical protein
VLGLWLPPELAPTGPSVESPESLDAIDDEPDESVAHAADSVPATDSTTVKQPVSTLGEALAIDAVEIDRLVPASGNLAVCGQQFWLGPARAGRTLTLWIDTTTVHLSLDGLHLKTLPTRPRLGRSRQIRQWRWSNLLHEYSHGPRWAQHQRGYDVNISRMSALARPFPDIALRILSLVSPRCTSPSVVKLVRPLA